MDCTPDLSHNKQLLVVLLVVNCDFKKGIAVHKHFVGFLLEARKHRVQQKRSLNEKFFFLLSIKPWSLSKKGSPI